MRSYRVRRYRHQDGSETVTVRRTSVIAAYWLIGCWCLARPDGTHRLG
jgi:hypothetical protein